MKIKLSNSEIYKQISNRLLKNLEQNKIIDSEKFAKKLKKVYSNLTEEQIRIYVDNEMQNLINTEKAVAVY